MTLFQGAMGAFATISAGLLGALLWAQAELRAADTRTLIRNLRKTGHYGVLLSTLRLALLAGCVTLLGSTLGFLFAAGARRAAMSFVSGGFVFMLFEAGLFGQKFYQVWIHLE